MGTRSIFHALPDALGIHLSRRKRVYPPAVLGVFVFFFVFFLLLAPPAGFPRGESIVIREDATFGETAVMLEEENVINSAFFLKGIALITGADREVQAGTYVFPKPLGMTTVLHHIVHGVGGIPGARVTFPEGTSVRKMAEILQTALPGFDAEHFIRIATAHEGRLFPDTYEFRLETTPEEVVQVMSETFLEKTSELRNIPSTHSFEEVLIMASLVELEAKTLEDRRMIAGILWNRVEQNRALQVDAVFGYIRGVETYHPSLADLEIDSPYNTYLYPGLPPGPIANPGTVSIEAALTPTPTEYLYYLTGDDGVMRYAHTFEEHKENRFKYLH